MNINEMNINEEICGTLETIKIMADGIAEKVNGICMAADTETPISDEILDIEGDVDRACTILDSILQD